MKSVTITPEGEIRINDGDITLEFLQGEVKGYIELVSINGDLSLWVNEEGLLENLPENYLLSLATAAILGESINPMVGPGVFTGGGDRDGETQGLTDEQAAHLVVLLEKAKEFIGEP